MQELLQKMQIPSESEAQEEKPKDKFFDKQLGIECAKGVAGSLIIMAALFGIGSIKGPGFSKFIGTRPLISHIFRRAVSYPARVVDTIAELSKIGDTISLAARRHLEGDEALLLSLIWSESGFDGRAVSKKGACGYTQLMPGTARALGVKNIFSGENIFGGAKYLTAQLKRFGRIDLALAAYNAGPEALIVRGPNQEIKKIIFPPYAETKAFVKRTLAFYNLFKEFQWPVKELWRISSKYGWRIDPFTKKKAFHTGIDLDARYGEKVYASISGRVTFTGRYNKRSGLTVVIQNKDEIETFYMHLSKIRVRRGQRVKAGQYIGNVGTTGRTTGPCVHLTLKYHGRLVYHYPPLYHAAKQEGRRIIVKDKPILLVKR